MEHSRKNEKYEKVSSPIINCQYVGVMLVLCWCYVGVMLVLCRCYVGVMLTSIVSHLNVYI